MPSNPVCSTKIGKVQLQIRQYSRCAGSRRLLIFPSDFKQEKTGGTVWGVIWSNGAFQKA